MHIALVFLLPLLAFVSVWAFIYMFKKGVENGIYQKTTAPKRQCKCGGNCLCKKG